MTIPDGVKEQFTIPNILIVVCGISGIAYLLKRYILAISVFAFALLTFLVTSTAYAPIAMLEQMEGPYTRFSPSPVYGSGEELLVHVLSGRYSLAEEFETPSSPGLSSEKRLMEGIRIHHLLPYSMLVTSGYSSYSDESQASIARRTAIKNGVDSTRIAMLETPTTTWEEANALKEKFGVGKTVIVVTDAVHLPRALSFFKALGFNVVGAPSGFLLDTDSTAQVPMWMPATRNIRVSNIILREKFAALKAFLLDF